MVNEIAIQHRITDIIDEYDLKIANIDAAVQEFNQAGEKLKAAACVQGTWGEQHLDTGRIYDHHLKASLRVSAWRYIYKGLQIERLASAKDKDRFERSMADPPEFTLENIRASFGDFIADPRANILRGLAEAFSDLDPVFKSHEKMKIGVKGLPKRVVIRGFGGWSRYGYDTVKCILNALAAYQGKPLVTHTEMRAFEKNHDLFLKPCTLEVYGQKEPQEFPARGVRLVKFKNGNGHLFFEPDTLKDVNKALNEYYGEVLPDCSDKDPKSTYTSTAVSKDLQYYPSTRAVIERVVNDLYIPDGAKILEPSCGCGRFLDYLKEVAKQSGKKIQVLGVEIDPSRVRECKEKGHKVLQYNFLELGVVEEYDIVVMNPPFYGKHYAKHVQHALKFLKPGGILKAVLPITARYDHGLLDGEWQDLPVGSFRESGTNVNTCILTIRKK